MNNGDWGRLQTSQNLLGQFWRLHSPRVENGGSIVRSDTPGEPLFVNANSIARAARSRAPRSTSGTLRPSVFTRTRTRPRRT